MLSEDNDYLSLTEAAKIVPGRPHTSSLWRACRKGVLGRNGERIYLEHVRFGGRIYTTKDALETYARRLTEADAEYFASKGGRCVDTTRADERAERELAAAGI